jgi:hypothetical protein
MERTKSFRPQLEELEDRYVPSSTNGIAGSMPSFYRSAVPAKGA